MCPFVVFIYAKNLRGVAGWGDGNQGKTKHISMPRQRTGFPISAAKIKNILFTSSAHLLHPRPRPHFSAGVQTMRARICSAFSCDVFARVVWLRLRRVRDYRISFCYLPHALATHYCLRITRARGGCFLRGRKALLNDFCRAFGHSKAR